MLQSLNCSLTWNTIQRPLLIRNFSTLIECQKYTSPKIYISLQLIFDGLNYQLKCAIELESSCILDKIGAISGKDLK